MGREQISLIDHGGGKQESINGRKRFWCCLFQDLPSL